MLVDMRSDTVTRPTPGMRAAMADAIVGDDVYGDDPTVIALQDHVAGLFGHEAALFTPSGTMANQIALQLSVPMGTELLCDADAHVLTYESGAAATYGNISSRTWQTVAADIDPDVVAGMIRPPGFNAVPTSALAIEQTHNRGGGAVISIDTLRDLRRVADEAGVALHCDGARIWHAHIADGIATREYGALFDTMSVCLSKGLGAPIGSLVIGSAEQMVRARVIRKRMGGAMRQVGVLAAAGRYALDHHLDRLADDHVRARRLAEGLAPYGVVDTSRVRTNIVLLDLMKSTWDAGGLAAAARAEGVLMSLMGPRLARFITHLDVDDEGVERAIEVVGSLLAR